MKYVIVGNSAAAVGCVEGIRSVDKTSPIVIISDEPHRTYSRPLISYWLEGAVDDEHIYYRGADFYEKNGVTAMLGVRCVKIEPESKRVILENGETVDYGKLLVAAGSSPFVPPVPGLATCENAFTFLSWDSAKAVRAAVTKSSRVVILGAGLIGLKAAEGLHGLCADITVVDLADRILPSILEADAAAIMQRHLEAHDIKFILSDAAAEVKDGALILKSGTVCPFDVLIVAVGVRANTGLIKDAGSEVARGIITDDCLNTSLPDVYAAGDCTESFDISCSQRRVLALLPNAYLQGETAGINMAGETCQFKKAIPMNAIGFFGKHIVSAGSYDGEEIVDVGENDYRKLVFADGVLRGFMIIGEVDRAGIYTSLVREKTPIDTLDMDILRDKPQLLMFGRSERKEKLAGGTL